MFMSSHFGKTRFSNSFIDSPAKVGRVGSESFSTEPGAGSTWTIRGLVILKEIRCLHSIDLVLPNKLDLPSDVKHPLDLMVALK